MQQNRRYYVLPIFRAQHRIFLRCSSINNVLQEAKTILLYAKQRLVNCSQLTL